MKVFLFLLVALVAVEAQRIPKVVQIKQGLVRGYSFDHYDAFAFFGIPYATAPTGAEKFKPPLPPPTWNGIFEAVDRYVFCQQLSIFPEGQFRFVEDCLAINVFAPNTNQTNLPVVVVIHGGGFQFGFGNTETPGQLITEEKNVIGVTFNYRLGPHGFLCLGTPDIPGNAGMRDQITALKWVKENIAAFGGNPNDITIAGCSAGGASVDLLMLSKAADGLFNKVIGQSGANIGAFAVQVDPTENARWYAKSINYDGPDNIEAIEEFFKNISYKQLFSYDLNAQKDVHVVMSPCMERDLGIERFLDDTPINILKSGNYTRYPVLYGWAGMEGLYRIQNFDDWIIHMNQDFTQFIPTDLKFESPEQKQQIADKVKAFYFGDTPVNNSDVLNYIDFNSDVMFNVAMQRSVTMQVEAGNNAMYVGVYSFTDNNTNIIPHTNVRGANHCEQTRAVFDLNDNTLTPEYIELRTAMRKMWLNFIHTGDPTPANNIPPLFPKWEPAAANRTPCLDIGRTIQVLNTPYDEERQRFWDDIYDRFKREPVAPYSFSSASSLVYGGVLFSSFLAIITMIIS